MSVIYSKVKMTDNIFEACKLIRKFIGLPIAEIKNKIQSSLYFNGKHKDSIKLLAFSETKTPNLSPAP